MLTRRYWIMTRTFLFLLAAALVFTAGVTATSAADGAAVYGANCAKCHGDTGHADTPVGKALKAPALAGDAKVAGTAPDDLVKLIKGNPKHKAFIDKLSAEDLATAAAQVKQLAGGK
jgi:mono/diheme cytochrome c family protein